MSTQQAVRSAPDPRQLAAMPLIRFRAEIAESAFSVHAALVRTEAANPHLQSNDHWLVLRDIAFAQFLAAFEAN